jgi:hypothetical protein
MRDSRRTSCLLPAVAASLVVGLSQAGCGRSETLDQRMVRIAQATGQQRVPTAKFAGKVTVDGQPPPTGTRVILFDPKVSPSISHPVLHAQCAADGSFEFTTYTPGDGVPLGKYVVLFERLVRSKSGYIRLEGLKNLYNDPDRNGAIPIFNVDVTQPGKADYLFELKVEGTESVTTPGPKSVTSIDNGT